MLGQRDCLFGSEADDADILAFVRQAVDAAGVRTVYAPEVEVGALLRLPRAGVEAADRQHFLHLSLIHI